MAHPGGRPSLYTPELADRICDLVSTHGISLRRICEKYPDLPHSDTINEWRAKKNEFSAQYLAAREKQAHILFDTSFEDIEEIKHYYYEDIKSGATCVDAGIVAAQRALANHKTFMASKIRPKDYGDKQIIEQTTSENEQLKSELAELRAKLAEKAKSEY